MWCFCKSRERSSLQRTCAWQRRHSQLEFHLHYVLQRQAICKEMRCAFLRCLAHSACDCDQNQIFALLVPDSATRQSDGSVTLQVDAHSYVVGGGEIGINVTANAPVTGFLLHVHDAGGTTVGRFLNLDLDSSPPSFGSGPCGESNSSVSLTNSTGSTTSSFQWVFPWLPPTDCACDLTVTAIFLLSIDNRDCDYQILDVSLPLFNLNLTSSRTMSAMSSSTTPVTSSAPETSTMETSTTDTSISNYTPNPTSTSSTPDTTPEPTPKPTFPVSTPLPTGCRLFWSTMYSPFFPDFWHLSNQACRVSMCVNV